MSLTLVLSPKSRHQPKLMVEKAMHGVALDMDGVIFDTVDHKATALLSIFEDRSIGDRAKIDFYNRANPGIPRADKLLHIAVQLLQVDAKAVEIWLQRYAAILRCSTLPPPLIAGARELFQDDDLKVFVCSSAPQSEILKNLAAHNLDGKVAGVFGFPVSKRDALVSLKGLYGAKLCFVGDADADRRAAREAGVRFILRSAAEQGSHPDEPVIPDLRNYRRWAFGR